MNPKESKNNLIMSYKLFELLNPEETKLSYDIYCPEDDFYLVDKNGDVHYFSYRGKNLAGIKESL